MRSMGARFAGKNPICVASVFICGLRAKGAVEIGFGCKLFGHERKGAGAQVFA
jgi:hypothetical protein